VFDSVIDSGLFHVFSDDDRKRYVESLASILKAGGRLFLPCFSDEEPGTQGPRRVSQKELHDAFAKGWVIESIQPSRNEVRPDLKELPFSEGRPKAWFVVIDRWREAALLRCGEKSTLSCSRDRFSGGVHPERIGPSPGSHSS
jgi:hypothetical protein